MKKLEFKKIFHILVISIVSLSLIVGVVFSIISSSQKITLDSKFSGGYEAVVGVYDKSLPLDDEGNPNGDSQEGAIALQNKLSPFSDNAVEVKQTGKNRITVRVAKDAYKNEETFSNAIEEDGGLFILNKDFEDVLFDDTLMTAIGSPVYKDGKVEKKLKVSEILGEAKAEAISVSGTSNKPFLTFNLPEGGWLSKMVTPPSTEGETKAAVAEPLTVMTNIDTVINNIRNYYLMTPNQESKTIDKYLQTYLDEIIAPLRTWWTNNSSSVVGKTLADLFTVHFTDPVSGNIHNINLLSSTTISDEKGWSTGANKYWVENINDLKAIFYGNNNENHDFRFLNSVSKYIYDPNSETKDFIDDPAAKGKYFEPIKSAKETGETEIGKIDKVFSGLTNVLFTNVLFTEKDNGLNKDLDEELFLPNIVFSNKLPDTKGDPRFADVSIVTETDGNNNLKPNTLYVKSKSYTNSKLQEAAIRHTTLGLSYKIILLNEFAPEITTAMFIVSMIVIAIIALATMIYFVIAYRLLGLFTILIAAIIGSMTMLIPVWFGITVGVEIILALFVSIAILIDISVILFESLKRNVYIDKRSVEASYKISNKETLWISIDTMLVAIIPSMILFWVGDGVLKNITTISVISMLFVVLFGIIITRLVIWSFVKLDIFKKHPTWFPMNTSLKMKSSPINSFLKQYYTEKLEYISSKEKLNSKELAKIKRWKDKISIYEIKEKETLAKQSKRQTERFAKSKVKQSKKIENYENLLKLETKTFIQKARMFFIFNKDKYQTNLHEELDYLTIKETNTLPNDSFEKKTNEHIERKVFKWSKIISIVIVFIFIVGIIIGTTVGPRFNASFGKDTVVILQGEGIDGAYDTLNYKDELEIKDKETLNLIVKSFDDAEKQAEEFKYDENLKKAYVVSEVMIDLLTSNLAHNIPNSRKLSDYHFTHKNIAVQYGNGYDQNPETPWVAFKTVLDIREKPFTAFLSWFVDGSKKSDSILKMQENPVTTYNQIKQLGIVFAFMLIALLVYISIRFKWTYFVALALGIIVTVGLSIAIVLIFQIPIGIEILVTIVSIIDIALITGILVLGKGQTFIKSKDKETLKFALTKEIELISNFKEYKKDIKNKVSIINKKIKDVKKQNYAKTKSEGYKLFKVKFMSMFRNVKFIKIKEDYLSVYDEWDGALAIYKLEKDQVKTEYKDNRKEYRILVNKEEKNNVFIKQIFASVVKYATFRMISIIGLFLVFALVLAITLPSIAGMGLTLFVGILTANVVIIVISLPVWLWLEKHRIFMVNGYKHFIRKQVVSAEEQIVKDIND